MQTRSSSTNRRVTRQTTAAQSTGVKRQALVQLQDTKRKRRRTTLATPSSSHTREQPCIPATSISATSQHTTVDEEREESARLRKELKQKDAEIERLTARASEREKEVEVSECIQALKFLEEHYTCALCLDVMAHPLTLPHPHCGHSFCGICILKHFFSQYHRACGNWHENVSCPMCRGILNYTPSLSSTSARSWLTFPFAKNRAADSAICNLVQKLAGEKLPQKKGRGKAKSKASEETDEALALWRHGGSSRNDWVERNQRGKTEVEYLSTTWVTLNSQDFTTLKDRLLV